MLHYFYHCRKYFMCRRFIENISGSYFRFVEDISSDSPFGVSIRARVREYFIRPTPSKYEEKRDLQKQFQHLLKYNFRIVKIISLGFEEFDKNISELAEGGMFLKTSVIKCKRGLFNICLKTSSSLTKISLRICKSLTKWVKCKL